MVGGNRKISLLPGCMREPTWPWWMQPLPWWTLFLLVPIYSICSSLSNLQYWRSLQLPVMVLFSCCAYAANHAASLVLPGRTDIVSAAGAFMIGSLGNVYSRVVRGTAFTSMVTGVLFLVPVSDLVFRGERAVKLFIFQVWDSSRWRSYPNISQFSGAIFQRVLLGAQDDISGCGRNNWTVC